MEPETLSIHKNQLRLSFSQKNLLNKSPVKGPAFNINQPRNERYEIFKLKKAEVAERSLQYATAMKIRFPSIFHQVKPSIRKEIAFFELASIGGPQNHNKSLNPTHVHFNFQRNPSKLKVVDSLSLTKA